MWWLCKLSNAKPFARCSSFMLLQNHPTNMQTMEVLRVDSSVCFGGFKWRKNRSLVWSTNHSPSCTSLCLLKAFFLFYKILCEHNTKLTRGWRNLHVQKCFANCTVRWEQWISDVASPYMFVMLGWNSLTPRAANGEKRAEVFRKLILVCWTWAQTFPFCFFLSLGRVCAFGHTKHVFISQALRLQLTH